MICNLLAQNDSITQLGVGGIIVILVVKEVFVFISKHNGNNNGKQIGVQEQVSQLQRTVQFKDTCAEIVKRYEIVFVSLEKKVDAEFKETKSLIIDIKQELEANKKEGET